MATKIDPKLNADIKNIIERTIRNEMPTLEDFAKAITSTGNDRIKELIESAEGDIDKFTDALNLLQSEMSFKGSTDELVNKLKAELEIVFQKSTFSGEVRNEKTAEVLRRIVTELTKAGDDDNGDRDESAFIFDIENAIKKVASGNKPIHISREDDFNISLDYIKKENPQIFNEISKVYNVENGNIEQTGSDAEFVVAINNGFRNVLQKQKEQLKLEIERQKNKLDRINATDGNNIEAIDKQHTVLKELEDSLNTIEKIQSKVLNKSQNTAGVNQKEIFEMQREAAKSEKDRQKDLDKQALKARGMFGNLIYKGKQLGDALNGVERAADDLGRVFDGVNGNNKSLNAMKDAFGNVTMMLSSGLVTIGAFSAGIALAGAALVNFHEDLNVARSYGGGSDMVKELQNLHLRTLMDPQQLAELSSNLGSNFGISLNKNQKELEKAAVKQRLTERVLGKQYAEQQATSLGELKEVLESTSVTGMMTELQSSTLALASTMGISNELALDHIKALANNTKEIGKTLDKGQRALLQNQMEEQLTALKGLGLSDEHAKEIMDSLKDVYTEEGASTTSLNTIQMMSMDPDTVNRIAASVGAGSGKQMIEAFKFLNMGHGDATKASVLMADKLGISQEEALKQINASVFAQKLAGNSLVEEYKKQNDYVRAGMLIDHGYNDGILAEQIHQTGALKNMSDSMSNRKDVLAIQKFMPDLNKVLIGLGATGEQSKNDILKKLIDDLSKDNEKRAAFEEAKEKGLSDEQAYAKVMSKDITKAAKEIGAGRATTLGGQQITDENVKKINNMGEIDLAEEIGRLSSTEAEAGKDRAERAATKAMYDLYDAILPLVNRVLPILTKGVEMLSSVVTFAIDNFAALSLALSVFVLGKLFFKMKNIISSLSGGLGSLGKKLFSSNKIDTSGISKSTKRISKEGNRVADTFRAITSKLKKSMSGLGGTDPGLGGKKKDRGGIFSRRKKDRGEIISRKGGLSDDGSSNLSRTINRLNSTMKHLIKSVDRLSRSMGDTGQSFDDFDFERSDKKSKRSKERTSSRSKRRTTSKRTRTSKLRSSATTKFESIKSSIKGAGKSSLGKIKNIGSSAGNYIGGLFGGGVGKAAGGLMKGLGKLAGPLAIAFTAVDGITGAIDGWSKASDYFVDDLEKQNELLQTNSLEGKKYAESLSSTGKAFWDGEQYIDEFGNVIEAQPKLFQKAASAFGGAIESLSFGFLDGQMVANATAGVFKWFGDVMDRIGLTDSLKSVGTLLSQFGSKLFDIGKSIINFMQPSLDAIKVVFTGIIETIKGFVDILVGVFTLDGDAIIGGIKSVLGGLFDIITSPFTALFGYFDEIFGTGLSGIFTSIKDSIFDIVGGYIDVVTAPFKSIMSWFSGEISFGEIFTNAWETTKDGFIKLFGGLKDIVLMPFEAAANSIKKLLSFIPGIGGNKEVDTVLETKGTATDSQKELADSVIKSLGIEKGMLGYKEIDKDALAEKTKNLSEEEIKAIIATDKIDNTNIEQLAEILVKRNESKPVEVEVASVPAKAKGGSTGGLGDTFAKMIMTTGTESPVATVGTDEFVFSKDMITDFLGLKGIDEGNSQYGFLDAIMGSFSAVGFGGLDPILQRFIGGNKKDELKGESLLDIVPESLSNLGVYLMSGLNLLGTSISGEIDKSSIISAKGFENLSELSENLLNTTEEVNADGTTVKVVTPTAKTNDLLSGILDAISNLKVMSGYSPEEGVTGDGGYTSRKATPKERKAAEAKFKATGNFVKDIASHIFKAETGNAKGGYNAAKDIGDGAGMSFGAYQLTEKSGGVSKYLAEMTKNGDTQAAALQSQMKGGWFQGDKSKLTAYLKKTGDTEQGRAAQDKIFSSEYLAPALRIAEKNNITDKAAIAQIIDHSVNAGVGGANRMVKKAGGDFSAQGIANARKKDYAGLKNYGKYGKGWTNRVNSLSSAFKDYEGQSITDTESKQKVAIEESQKPVVASLVKATEKVTEETNKLASTTKIAEENNKALAVDYNKQSASFDDLTSPTISLLPYEDDISRLEKRMKDSGNNTDVRKLLAKKRIMGEKNLNKKEKEDLSLMEDEYNSMLSAQSIALASAEPLGPLQESIIDKFSQQGPNTLNIKNSMLGIDNRPSSKINDTLQNFGDSAFGGQSDFSFLSSGRIGSTLLSSSSNISSGMFDNRPYTTGLTSKLSNLTYGAPTSIPSAATSIPSGFSGAMNNITNNNNIPGEANANLEKMISELVFVNKQQLGHLGKTAMESALQTRQAQKSHKAQIDRHDNFRQHDITTNRNMVLK